MAAHGPSPKSCRRLSVRFAAIAILLVFFGGLHLRAAVPAEFFGSSTLGIAGGDLPTSYEALAYFVGSLLLFALSSKAVFITVGIFSVLAGVLVGWIFSFYGTLWYKRFRRNLAHSIWTGLASLVSVLGVWMVAASAYAPQIALVSVLLWRAELTFDSEWSTETFAKAYQEVKRAGHEDFSNYPPPPEGTRIPADHPESNRIWAAITSEQVHAHFDRRRPLLSLVLGGDADGDAEKLIEHRMKQLSADGATSSGMASLDILLDLAEEIPAWSLFLGKLDAAVEAGGPVGRYLANLGVSREGLRSAMESIDRELERIEGRQNNEKGKTMVDFAYSVVANEILEDARAESARVRIALVAGIVAVWGLILAIPFLLIGRAARNEADLTRHTA